MADLPSLQDFNVAWHLATLKVVLFDNFRLLTEKSIPPEGFLGWGILLGSIRKRAWCRYTLVSPGSFLCFSRWKPKVA